MKVAAVTGNMLCSKWCSCGELFCKMAEKKRLFDGK